MIFLYSVLCLVLAVGLFWGGRRAERRQKHWRVSAWMVAAVMTLFLAVVLGAVGLYGVIFQGVSGATPAVLGLPMSRGKLQKPCREHS